jgi:hypothetical protein
MKVGLVFALLNTVLFLVCTAAGLILCWLALQWWRGKRIEKFRGVAKLTTEARAAYARHLSIIAGSAGLWLFLGAGGIVRFGLVHSAWTAVLSVAAAIVVCGFHWARARHGVNAA